MTTRFRVQEYQNRKMRTKKGDVTASKPKSSNQTSQKGGATTLGIADAVEEELEELIKSANNDDTLT
jgi:hypothetical protein